MILIESYKDKRRALEILNDAFLDTPGIMWVLKRRSKVSNENIKKIQLAYELIFKTKSFRDNIEDLNSDLKNNVFVKKILNFINSDKKRPISLPPSK